MYGHIILKLHIQTFGNVKHGSVCERVYIPVADRLISYVTIWIFRFYQLRTISLTGDLV
jgi:hypothetical protein